MSALGPCGSPIWLSHRPSFFHQTCLQRSQKDRLEPCAGQISVKVTGSGATCCCRAVVHKLIEFHQNDPEGLLKKKKKSRLLVLPPFDPGLESLSLCISNQFSSLDHTWPVTSAPLPTPPCHPLPQV